MPQITLDDLSVGFRGPLLLNHVSARIHRGDKIGLLGRNGAGKTT
jgi:ATP-binding cassette subfamily F protein uup